MISETLHPPGFIRFCLTLLLGLGVSGCFGSTTIPSVPAFLIVVNNAVTGLVEYPLPLATGSTPLFSLAAAGTYEGGVTVQNDLFIFGKDSGNVPSLWRYTLPLSKSPSPMQLTGFQGTPVAALSLSGGQYVVFLEKTGSSQACLEGFTAGGLISTGASTLPSPVLACTSSTFSLPGSFQGGTMQLSGNGSTLVIETTYQNSGVNQTTMQAFSTGTLMNSPFPPATATHALSGTLSTFPVEGAAESNNVLLLLPNPSAPAVDFFEMTSIQSGSNQVSPLTQNSLSGIPLFPLLVLDPFGSFVYMATTQGGSSSPTIYSFSLNAIQNSSNAAPFAQVGTGLNPVALLTVVGSQG